MWHSPWLRDCGESAFNYPIGEFCRGAFRESDLFIGLGGAARALDLHVDPLVATSSASNASATITTTLRSAVRGLQWEATLTGPALLRAEVSEVGAGMYAVLATVHDGGEYALEVSLMWENISIATSPRVGTRPRLDEFVSHRVRTPDAFAFRKGAPLCRPLRLLADGGGGGGASAPPFAVARVLVSLPPRAPVTRACAPLGSARYLQGHRADRGRWLNVSAEARRAGVPLALAVGCELVWTPLTCALQPYDRERIDACVNDGVRLVLAGDSHARMLFAAIAAASVRASAAWKYAGGMGLLVDNSNTRRWSSKTLSTTLAATGALEGNVTHFVFNYGAWDLAYVPADSHILDWAFFISGVRAELALAVRRWQQNQHDKPPLMAWRTHAPHAIRFNTGHEHERRSNAKIEWVAARHAYLDWLQRDLSHPRDSAARIWELDTLAVALPRFHDASDAHHYISPDPGRPRAPRRAQPDGLSPWRCGAATALGSELNFTRLRVSSCPLGPSAFTSVGVTDAVMLLNSICNRESE